MADIDYSAPFWMSRLKLQRAEELLREVGSALDEYHRNPPLTMSGLQQDEQGYYFEYTLGRGPMRATAIMGDVVHNLRTALDLMASELARLANESDKSVYFPFAESAAELDGQIKARNFHRAGRDAVDLLKEYAPYRGGNIALRGLHDMDVQDKHKILVPIDQTIGPTLKIPIGDGGRPMFEEAVQSHDPALLRIVFPADSPFAGNDVFPVLEELVKLVHGIVEAFASLVASRD